MRVLIVATVLAAGFVSTSAAFPPDEDEARARAIMADRLIEMKRLRGLTIKSTGFARVPQPKSKPKPRLPSLAQTIPVGTFAADLVDGTRLVGKPATQATLTLKLDFASIGIPLEKIKGVEASKDRRQHTVLFQNGDRLTGAVVGSEVRFSTKFGDVTFPTVTLVKLTAGAKGAATAAPVTASPSPATRPVSRASTRPFSGPTDPGARPSPFSK